MTKIILLIILDITWLYGTFFYVFHMDPNDWYAFPTAFVIAGGIVGLSLLTKWKIDEYRTYGR